MASYVVMKRTPGAGDSDAENVAFIRDGFALIAFFLPVLWLLWHRLWIEAALALALTVGLAALGNVSGFGAVAPAFSLLVSLYAGLEGAALRIAAMRRRGWSEVGVVEADSRDDAETRWFLEASAGTDHIADRFDTRMPFPGPHRTPAPSAGLLLNPGQS